MTNHYYPISLFPYLRFMILVTGATGLLGSRLIFDLASQGQKVRALKRPSSRMNCIDFYFEGREDLKKFIEWQDADVNDIFSLEIALENVDFVYHCAGKVSFQRNDKDLMDHVNINGTANLVNMCIEKGIKKICHASSVAALGRTGVDNNIDESALWKTSAENSSYAISKYGAEREVWRGVAEGLDAVIVNPGIIIGPGNWKTDSSMIFRQVWKGLRFYTSGITGFVDVKDVSKAMIQLMQSEIKNERFILVSENKPFKEVFDRIAINLKKKRSSIYAGPLLTGLVWRIELVKSIVTGSKAVITKSSARSAQGRNYYSSEKIKKTLGMEFIDVMKSVDDTSISFLNGMLRQAQH